MKTVPLRSVARIVSGGTPKTSETEFWNGDIAWATPKDLSTLHSIEIFDTPRKITQAGLRQSSAEILPRNSVLFSSRAPIGLIAINAIPMATNQGFKSFIPDSDELDSRYLYRWLELNRPRLQSMGVGATFKEVSKAIVSRLELPLPPLDEQRRIAALLDKADELRAKRRRALAHLDALTQSIFKAMFGELGRDMDDCRIGPLSEFADVVSGITKGRRTKVTDLRSVAYLAVSNVQDKRLNLDSVKEIDATEEEIERYRLRRDDLLLTEGGDPDKLGRGTLWKEELPIAIHQNHVFRVRVHDTEQVEPLFLHWLTGSDYGKAYFFRAAKQTTGIASINKTQLSAFPLLLPPTELQREFTQRLTAVERLKEHHRAQLAHLDTLFASLQHRAFKGEL